jgi:hypothetical protein
LHELASFILSSRQLSLQHTSAMLERLTATLFAGYRNSALRQIKVIVTAPTRLAFRVLLSVMRNLTPQCSSKIGGPS